MLDFNKIREDFPILNQKINNLPLVYLDNAASSQKPKQVIEAIKKYYETMHSNVHRGVHTLSQRATIAFEAVREKVKKHINAQNSHEIIYTKGTTEGINLVAQCMTPKLSSQDEIIVSTMAHHSNIVPWQMLCERTGAKLRVIEISDLGELDLFQFESLLNKNTKLISVGHISNALGTLNPVKNIIEMGHSFGAIVLLDGAQAAPHMAIDVQDLDVDYYTFSSHKMCGPTGIGILYGKEELLNSLIPYQGGGEMIKEVNFTKTIYADLPFKFEAGTPNIADTIGFGVAIDYLNSIGMNAIAIREAEIVQYAFERLSDIDNLEFVGLPHKRASVISFNLKNVHPFDVGMILDKQGVAVRTGHHCAQPLMNRLGISGTIRASFAFYNTKEEVDILISAIDKAKTMLC